jgi:hypothetical protein
LVAAGAMRSATIAGAPTKSTSTTRSPVAKNHSVSGSAHFRSFVPS